jgi:hypothetical protein
VARGGAGRLLRALDAAHQVSSSARAGDRDKRVIYASTLAALKKYEIEPSAENETAARVAVSEVALVARHHVWSAAQDEFANLVPVSGEKDSERSARCRLAWDRMVRVMRSDLGVSEEWTG